MRRRPLHRQQKPLTDLFEEQGDLDGFLDDECPEHLKEEWRLKIEAGKARTTESDINKRHTDPLYLVKLKRRRRAKA